MSPEFDIIIFDAFGSIWKWLPEAGKVEETPDGESQPETVEFLTTSLGEMFHRCAGVHISSLSIFNRWHTEIAPTAILLRVIPRKDKGEDLPEGAIS